MAKLKKKYSVPEDAVIIVCDVETTGMSAHSNRITEIAMLKIKDGQIADKFTTLVNPGQHIPYSITYLTGITNEMVIKKKPFEEIACDIKKFIYNDSEDREIIFAGHNVSFDYRFIREAFLRCEDPFKIDLKTICTCRLARRLHPKLKSKSLGSVAKHLKIEMKKAHRALDDAKATAHILLHFLERLREEQDCISIHHVLSFQNKRIYDGKDKISPALKRSGASLKDFPQKPGVYFMKENDDILYIGKAKNLKDRLSSYFRHNSEHPLKIQSMLSKVNKVEYEITNSELSALILESKLIKKHKPKFNSAMKRHKFYPFIKIDIQNDYPKVQKVLEIENDGANYYGPFTSRFTVAKLIEDIENSFKVRQCKDKVLIPSRKHSTCFYFDIGKCMAPCNLSQSKDDYRKEIYGAHDFLTSDNGKSAKTIYYTLMVESSEKMDYETAAYMRDRVRDITRVMSYQKVITSAINNRKIIIKCDIETNREVFLIHNGKLVKTFYIRKDEEVNHEAVFNEIAEDTEYLFFSLSRYIRHNYSREELDEIKVISNWLALNRDRNSYLEITDSHTKDDILTFIFA